MSEGMREIAPRFLQITHEITMKDGASIVMLSHVAKKLNPAAPKTDDLEYMDWLSKVAMYLGRRGFLKRESADWGMFSITAEGIDEGEGTNKPADTGSIFNIYGPVHGSVIGTHNKNELTNVFNFDEFDRVIEDEGGEDKAELIELREQLRQLIEERETVNRGLLAQFSALLQRYPKFADFIGRAAAAWLTQQTSIQ